MARSAKFGRFRADDKRLAVEMGLHGTEKMQRKLPQTNILMDEVLRQEDAERTASVYNRRLNEIEDEPELPELDEFIFPTGE